MRVQRAEALPNETGGVLVGRFDLEKKTLYVGRALRSPTNSVETPTSYIRGTSDLKTQLKQIRELSGGDLRYVGEWHTHPNGVSTKPSQYDATAHLKITEKMKYEGLPGVVAIQGEDKIPYFMIDIEDYSKLTDA